MSHLNRLDRYIRLTPHALISEGLLSLIYLCGDPRVQPKIKGAESYTVDYLFSTHKENRAGGVPVESSQVGRACMKSCMNDVGGTGTYHQFINDFS